MKIFAMLKIVLKNVAHKPVTRRYPAQRRTAFPGERGVLTMPDEPKCIYCGLCSRKCPSHAITVTRAPEKQWKYERFRCILCGACIDACPKKCLTFEPYQGK